MTDLIRLRYVGEDRYLIGVPACDFDADPADVEALIATGLYESQPDPIPDAEDGVDEEGD